MNTLTQKTIVLFIITGIAITAAALVPTSTVLAAANPPTAATPVPGTTASQPAVQGNPTRIERLFRRELAAFQLQENRLDRTGELITRAEKLLEKLGEKGVDISALQKALQDFKDAIPAARASHDSAGAILKARAGFDENGKVVEIQAARKTVQSAGKDLRDCHFTLRTAVDDLVKVIRQYRSQKTATPTP